MRFLVAPDDSDFLVMPDEPPRGRQLMQVVVPGDYVEVEQAEYEQRLAAAVEKAAQASAAFLRSARAPQLSAAQALVGLGLTADQAAALAGVPVGELEPALP